MSEAPPRRGKKKHRQPEAEVDPEFQIAPMIDILLVLLVFFMSISSTEVLQSNQEINLPVAKEAKDAKENPGQVIINVLYTPINNATSLIVNERTYPSPADLISVLQNNVAKNPMVRVLIRADREVRYESLRSLLEAVGQAGIANVTFSVVDKEVPAN
ncbi:MAG: ExbD/TolR family protein [Chthoniobacterales bacterium]